MSAATHARAFEEGFTTKASGSGMGLFICKSLLEARGGSINLNSMPGEGSTVRVCLPFESEPVIGAEHGREKAT
jgi:two-component system, NtrC family, sensor histidine kinase HydH